MEDIIREAAAIDRITLHSDLGIDQLNRVHILKMLFARLAGQNDFDIIRALHIRKQLVPQRDAASGKTPMPSNRLPSLSAGTGRPLAAPHPDTVHVAPLRCFSPDAGKAVTAFVRV